jgi:hypothetical protein
MLENFDLKTIEQEIQNRAQEAREEAIAEIEQDVKFPEIAKVFHQVYQHNA